MRGEELFLCQPEPACPLRSPLLSPMPRELPHGRTHSEVYPFLRQMSKGALYAISWAAITKYHHGGGVKRQKSVLSQLCHLKSEVWPGPHCLGAVLGLGRTTPIADFVSTWPSPTMCLCPKFPSSCPYQGHLSLHFGPTLNSGKSHLEILYLDLQRHLLQVGSHA